MAAGSGSPGSANSLQPPCRASPAGAMYLKPATGTASCATPAGDSGARAGRTETTIVAAYSHVVVESTPVFSLLIRIAYAELLKQEFSLPPHVVSVPRLQSPQVFP